MRHSIGSAVTSVLGGDQKRACEVLTSVFDLKRDT
jgi:hypothetical protein